MCHGGFKNKGLRVWPFTENGGFQNWPTREKIWDFGAKNNKETYICLKRKILSSCTDRKKESLGAGKAKNGTYPYCPNMGVPPGSNLKTKVDITGFLILYAVLVRLMKGYSAEVTKEKFPFPLLVFSFALCIFTTRLLGGARDCTIKTMC